MMVSVYLEGELIFVVDTKKVHEGSFPDLMRQASNVLLGKWVSEKPQNSHKLKISEEG